MISRIAPTGKRTGITVAALIADYWKWAKAYYTATSAYGIRTSLRVLRGCHGSTDAGSFGPNALRIVRDAMVLGKAEGKHRRCPPRMRSRSSIAATCTTSD